MSPYLSDRNADFKKYHSDFIGLAGTKKQIAHFARLFGMSFMPSQEVDKNKSYEVNHSASFYLTDQRANLYAVFSTPHDMEMIYKDIIKTIK